MVNLWSEGLAQTYRASDPHCRSAFPMRFLCDRLLYCLYQKAGETQRWPKSR
jgi:hypothetical protein